MDDSKQPEPLGTLSPAQDVPDGLTWSRRFV